MPKTKQISEAPESSAGDDFHVLWTMKKSFELLNFDDNGLKAITVESIAHHSKEYKNGVLGLFTELATNKDGKKMTLNPFDEQNNKKKAMFHFINGGVQIRKVDSFTRHIKF